MSGLVRGPRWVVVAAAALVVSLAGAAGIVTAADSRLDEVGRIPSVDPVLSEPADGIVNFLLVGSDSREGIDTSDPDNVAIGSPSNVLGERSDSLIVVRWERATGDVALMSVPRDLWVRIGDTNESSRINAAYGKGPAVLVRTVQRALGIPIHHYVEVGFLGFRDIVDGVGGVRLCVDNAVRDTHIRLDLAKGCHVLDGVSSLRYVRSRHYQELVDGEWRDDGTGDEGRGTRQRGFIAAMVKAAVRHVASDPMSAGDVVSSFAAAVAVDGSLDLVDLARKLRPLASGSAKSYRLPVDPDTSGGMFKFRLSGDAQELLAYFAGRGPAPVK